MPLLEVRNCHKPYCIIVSSIFHLEGNGSFPGFLSEKNC